MKIANKLNRRIALQQLEKELGDLESSIGYIFHDKKLIIQALTHRSYLNETDHDDMHSNERLEFLGDSILSHIVSLEIFTQDSGEEGRLSQLRSNLVDTNQCALYCQKLGLQDYLLFGRGLLTSGEKAFIHLCANLFEAVLAAICLDSDFDSARRFFLDHFSSSLQKQLLTPTVNWKAKLQTYCQKTLGKTPQYKVVEEKGPEHAKLFCMEIQVDSQSLASAWQPSKRQAQIEAAKSALMEHFGLSMQEIHNI